MVQSLLLVALACAALAAASPAKVLDLRTSSVSEDLYALYHSVSPVADYLSWLAPAKDKGNPYDEFRFLTGLQDRGDFYFYLYFRDYASLPSGATFSLSYDLSTDLTAEGFRDDFSASAVPSLVSGSGAWQKWRVPALFPVSDGLAHRIAVGEFAAVLHAGSIDLPVSFGCEGFSLAWKDGDRKTDLSLHDNYVCIRDAAAGVELVPQEYWSADSGCLKSADERHWLFFDYDPADLGDYAVSKLVGARVSYDYSSFDLQYRSSLSGSSSYLRSDGNVRGSMYGASLYLGLKDDAGPFISWADGANGFGRHSFVDRNRNGELTALDVDGYFDSFGVCGGVSVERNVTSVVEPSTVTYSKPIGVVSDWFEWLSSSLEGTSQVSYSFQTLQALDDSSVSDPSFSADHVSFLKYFRSYGGASRKYGLCFRDDQRVLAKIDPAHIFYRYAWVHSACHEATAIHILSLTFNNAEGTADFSAIMDPIDETFVAVTDPDVYVPVPMSKRVTDPAFWKAVAVASGAAIVTVGCAFWTALSLKSDLVSGGRVMSSPKTKSGAKKRDKEPGKSKTRR